MLRASLTLAMVFSCGPLSFKRRLSTVRTCSNKMTESRSMGYSLVDSSIWVGSFAFLIREVMGATMVVGL